MKEKILYHGSVVEVTAPEFGAGNRHNDYGLGFYCTESPELAAEWACGRHTSGYVNKYRLDVEGLSRLDLESKGYHILNWLAVLLENRKFELNQPIPLQIKQYILQTFLPDYKNVDIMIGYRADDSYFSFAKDFLTNSISLAQLQRAMKLGKLGRQVVLISQAAFDRLEFMGSTLVDGEVWYQKRIERDIAARQSYADMHTEQVEADATLAIDIMRGKWQNDDERLQ